MSDQSAGRVAPSAILKLIGKWRSRGETMMENSDCQCTPHEQGRIYGIGLAYLECAAKLEAALAESVKIGSKTLHANPCQCVYCVGTRDDLVEYAADLEIKIADLLEKFHEQNQPTSI
jgi:hypothetical protein